MAQTIPTPGYMTPRSPSSDWSEAPEKKGARDELSPRLPQALGSPAPVSRSLPISPPTPPLHALRPKIKSNILARSHAEKLKARLQLAYFRVRTNQVQTPLNEIII